MNDVTAPVFLEIDFPADVDPERALEIARRLLPCESGHWDPVQLGARSGRRFMVGNLDLAEWFWLQHSRVGWRAEDSGVRVEFEGV